MGTNWYHIYQLVQQGGEEPKGHHSTLQQLDLLLHKQRYKGKEGEREPKGRDIDTLYFVCKYA